MLLDFRLDYLADGRRKGSQPLCAHASSQLRELEDLLLHNGFAAAFAPGGNKHGSGGKKTPVLVCLRQGCFSAHCFSRTKVLIVSNSKELCKK